MPLKFFVLPAELWLRMILLTYRSIYRYAFKYIAVLYFFSVRVLISCSSSAVPYSSCASTRASLRIRYRRGSMNFIAQPIAGTQAIGVTVFTSVCAPIELHPPSCSDVDVLLTDFELLLVLIHPYLSLPPLPPRSCSVDIAQSPCQKSDQKPFYPEWSLEIHGKKGITRITYCTWG